MPKHAAQTLSTILDGRFDAKIFNGDLMIMRDLKRAFPDRQHVPIVDCNFALSAFLKAKGVEVKILVHEPTPPQVNLSYVPHEIYAWNDTAHSAGLYCQTKTAAFEFKWEGVEYVVYKVSWTENHGVMHCLYDFTFEAADGTNQAGQDLVTEIYKWSKALKEEVWVFEQGRWRKDKLLHQSIQSSTWDDIVLDDAFIEGLKRDTTTFFSAQEVYKSLGITWKRGLLLLGPPGNGKTESIKVLLKESEYPALYVKSFTTQFGPEHGVKSIFEHARNNAPCILVLEDLDSMVGPDVRSFFLNELDGLVHNEGILTIATTNHPERIDDAILNRPSRFDVKYQFDLPTAELRQQYIVKWIHKSETLAPGAQSSKVKFEKGAETLAKELSEKTEGWSFAFLKELFVSFLLRLAHDRATQLHSNPASQSDGALTKEFSTADDILVNQAEILSSQIMKIREHPVDEPKASSGMEARRTRMSYAVLATTPALHVGANF